MSQRLLGPSQAESHPLQLMSLGNGVVVSSILSTPNTSANLRESSKSHLVASAESNHTINTKINPTAVEVKKANEWKPPDLFTNQEIFESLSNSVSFFLGSCQKVISVCKRRIKENMFPSERIARNRISIQRKIFDIGHSFQDIDRQYTYLLACLSEIPRLKKDFDYSKSEIMRISDALLDIGFSLVTHYYEYVTGNKLYDDRNCGGLSAEPEIYDIVITSLEHGYNLQQLFEKYKGKSSPDIISESDENHHSTRKSSYNHHQASVSTSIVRNTQEVSPVDVRPSQNFKKQQSQPDIELRAFDLDRPANESKIVDLDGIKSEESKIFEPPGSRSYPTKPWNVFCDMMVVKKFEELDLASENVFENIKHLDEDNTQLSTKLCQTKRICIHRINKYRKSYKKHKDYVSTKDPSIDNTLVQFKAEITDYIFPSLEYGESAIRACKRLANEFSLDTGINSIAVKECKDKVLSAITNYFYKVNEFRGHYNHVENWNLLPQEESNNKKAYVSTIYKDNCKMDSEPAVLSLSQSVGDSTLRSENQRDNDNFASNFNSTVAEDDSASSHSSFLDSKCHPQDSLKGLVNVCSLSLRATHQFMALYNHFQNESKRYLRRLPGSTDINKAIENFNRIDTKFSYFEALLKFSDLPAYHQRLVRANLLIMVPDIKLFSETVIETCYEYSLTIYEKMTKKDEEGNGRALVRTLEMMLSAGFAFKEHTPVLLKVHSCLEAEFDNTALEVKIFNTSFPDPDTKHTNISNYEFDCSLIAMEHACEELSSALEKLLSTSESYGSHAFGLLDSNNEVNFTKIDGLSELFSRQYHLSKLFFKKEKNRIKSLSALKEIYTRAIYPLIKAGDYQLQASREYINKIESSLGLQAHKLNRHYSIAQAAIDRYNIIVEGIIDRRNALIQEYVKTELQSVLKKSSQDQPSYGCKKNVNFEENTGHGYLHVRFYKNECPADLKIIKMDRDLLIDHEQSDESCDKEIALSSPGEDGNTDFQSENNDNTYFQLDDNSETTESEEEDFNQVDSDYSTAQINICLKIISASDEVLSKFSQLTSCTDYHKIVPDSAVFLKDYNDSTVEYHKCQAKLNCLYSRRDARFPKSLVISEKKLKSIFESTIDASRWAVDACANYVHAIDTAANTESCDSSSKSIHQARRVIDNYYRFIAEIKDCYIAVEHNLLSHNISHNMEDAFDICKAEAMQLDSDINICEALKIACGKAIFRTDEYIRKCEIRVEAARNMPGFKEMSNDIIQMRNKLKPDIIEGVETFKDSIRDQYYKLVESWAKKTVTLEGLNRLKAGLIQISGHMCEIDPLISGYYSYATCFDKFLGSEIVNLTTTEYDLFQLSYLSHNHSDRLRALLQRL
ncbi:hypothetical protein NADFUDRAFT_52579 [Nadsonia fulvescens var. elongata DSM 6958]|uniref:Uncharacterized protein n=1 Tax=Nadsonia fulvescens var. elongata DSM 6958 TaxID=857566 RepID=A0A1E3PHA7_9ASCO|nr:hypothetical protein NADFUDRAFT_52579 [Nadsonia fulvescens var. elongata DSM 6958]